MSEQPAKPPAKKPSVPPVGFVTAAWKVHRGFYRLTGKRVLHTARPGQVGHVPRRYDAAAVR